MKPSARTAVSFFAAFTLTAGLTLSVLWPKTTLADDDDDVDKDDITLDADSVGDKLVVKGELVRDAKAKGGWVVEVKVENRGTAEETCDLETDVSKTVANPMSRAMPMPTTVWKTHEKVTLAAGEKLAKRYVVPENVAKQLTANANANAAAQRRAGGKPQLPTATTFFGVRFQKANGARG